MRIDMFVYNRSTSDTQVLKEARTLATAGHQVRIVAVPDPTTTEREGRDGFRIERIERNPRDPCLVDQADFAVFSALESQNLPKKERALQAAA